MRDVVPARATRGEKTSEDRMPGVSAAPAREAHGDIEVVVFEADERVGRSILATGNGRCNFSNAHVEAGCYRNAAFVAAAFGALEACCVRTRRMPPLSMTRAWVHRRCGRPHFLQGRVDRSRYGAGFSGGADKAAAGARYGCASDGVRRVLVPLRGRPGARVLRRIGAMWREEGEGRLYPLANKASSVLDVLRAALARGACGRRANAGRRASTRPSVRTGATTCASPTGRSRMPAP